MPESPSRYLSRARWLHWSMAALVLLAYALILSRGQFDRGSFERGLVVVSHFWVGIIILILVVPRLIHRYRHTPPPISPPLPSALHGVSRLSHYLLYAFLVVQPLLGIATVLLERGALPVPLTALALPSPFPVNPDAAHWLESVHIWLGTASYYLVGLHASAALWHHFARRDDTLRRML